MVEIVSYSKFKNTSEYRKYTSSVEINMQRLGYAPSPLIDLEPFEKVKDRIKNFIDIHQWKKGKIVWYKRTGDCGLQYMTIFYNSKTEEK